MLHSSTCEPENGQIAYEAPVQYLLMTPPSFNAKTRFSTAKLTMTRLRGISRTKTASRVVNFRITRHASLPGLTLHPGYHFDLSACERPVVTALVLLDHANAPNSAEHKGTYKHHGRYVASQPPRVQRCSLPPFCRLSYWPWPWPPHPSHPSLLYAMVLCLSRFHAA